MRRLIGSLVIWLAMTGAAAAQCSAINPSACGTPAMNGANIGGLLTSVGNAGSLAGSWGGTPTWLGLNTFSGGASITGGTLSGTFAGNPTLSGNVTLSGAGTSLAVTNNATFGTLGTSGTYQNYVSGASTTTPWLQGFFNVGGTTTYSAGPLYTGFYLAQNEGASHPNQNQIFFQILDQTNSSLWSGSRQALAVKEFVRASSSNMPCSTVGCDYFVTATFDTVINANAGGTNVSPFGLGIGISPTCTLENTATYWISCHGIETSSGITGSASSQELSQIKIYDSSIVRATYESSLFSMTAVNVTPVTGSGLVGSLYGIEFGSLYSGNWPFASDSTMIAALPRTLSPNAGQIPPLANIGVDFTQVNFTTNAWQSPGFYVDAKGQLTHLAGNGSITDTSNGIAIDIPNLAVTACTIGGNSGSTYVAQTGSPPVFDIVREPVTGTLCKITAVNRYGNVIGITLAQPGYSSVANPTNQAVTGGTGNQALTVNLTTATSNTLTLNPSGGPVIVNGNNNTGGQNFFSENNAGTPSNAATIATIQSILTAGTAQYLAVNSVGGASPLSQIQSGGGNTAGLQIQTIAGPINFTPATTLQINGTAGVTCAGAPTGAFASTNGIVTHC